MLSYLPLSHVAANMADIHAPMAVRGTTYFADKNALKAGGPMTEKSLLKIYILKKSNFKKPYSFIF
jgi:hypothetical protein